MTSFAVKAAPRPDDLDVLTFDEKSMWRGKTIRPGDEVFLFGAEHNGGRGLYGRGTVTDAVRGAGSRVALTVTRTGTPVRPLGRTDLKAFRDRPEADPGHEIDHKLYRQATNKITGLSVAATTFLLGYF